MPEKFIPEDAMPREHRDMAKKLAESHGQEGGHTIPSVKKRKMFGLRKTTFAEKQNWAGQNLWTDAILGKLKPRRSKASPTDQKEKSAIEKVGNVAEWADEKIEDEGEGVNKQPEEKGDETPGGFLQESAIEQRGREKERKIKEVENLAGVDELTKIYKMLLEKRTILRSSLYEFRGEVIKQESIRREIDKVIDEEQMIKEVVASMGNELSEDDGELAKKIRRYVDVFIAIILDRIKLSVGVKNEHQIGVYDSEINDMRELIAALIRDHSRKKND